VIVLVLAGVSAGYVLVGWWMRRHPSALPYRLRFFLAVPRRALRRERLLAILRPEKDERVLEVGPGTGYYTFAVAEALQTGRLDILDIQQDYLDHVSRAAEARGADNIVPMVGDASSLSYESDNFDAVFLVSVLGEIPDEGGALREFARVLRPQGRLVIGESLLGGDPHAILFSRLRERVEPFGFRFERRLGNAVSYFALFRANGTFRSE
jgi:ubiquinone/menaquinone biosynthesis C-methylase UbiE